MHTQASAETICDQICEKVLLRTQLLIPNFDIKG